MAEDNEDRQRQVEALRRYVNELSVTSRLNVDYQSAAAEKRTYTDKLEEAQGDDIFKYLLLINTSALDAYIAQARLQAEQSFSLSRRLAMAGFLLLATGIALSLALTVRGDSSLDAAYLAAVGVL